MSRENSKFIVTTTSILDGLQVKYYLGAINVNIVIGTNFFSDFAASFTDVFGGASGTYQRKMDLMYESAQKALIDKAKRLGANAILGFKTDFDEISGKGKSMFMISVTGTACYVDNNNLKKDMQVSAYVDNDLLKSEILKNKVLIRLIEEKTELSDEEWSILSENVSYDLVTLLVEHVYFKVSDNSKAKIEALVNQLNNSKIVDIVYSIYMNPLMVKRNVVDSNSPFSKEEIDASVVYEKLIRNCNLFNPKYLNQLIDIDLYKAISIMDSEKLMYSSDDIIEMQAICKKLDNLPDKGKMIKEKSGIFSKDEKEIYYCQHGHRNGKSDGFCIDCHENIKGLHREQVSKIKDFEMRTKVLTSLISKEKE